MCHQAFPLNSLSCVTGPRCEHQILRGTVRHAADRCLPHSHPRKVKLLLGLPQGWGRRDMARCWHSRGEPSWSVQEILHLVSRIGGLYETSFLRLSPGMQCEVGGTSVVSCLFARTYELGPYGVMHLPKATAVCSRPVFMTRFGRVNAREVLSQGPGRSACTVPYQCSRSPQNASICSVGLIRSVYLSHAPHTLFFLAVISLLSGPSTVV